MVDYVCGFLRDEIGRVLLLKKNVKNWQNGLLNGVGGKIEPDETSVQAMHREWAEETKTGPQDWTEFCYLSGDTYKVVFFKATTENLLNLPFPNKNDVGEYFQTFYIDDIHTFNVVPNLLWLIPMAFKDPANPKASLVLDTVRGKG